MTTLNWVLVDWIAIVVSLATWSACGLIMAYRWFIYDDGAGEWWCAYDDAPTRHIDFYNGLPCPVVVIFGGPLVWIIVFILAVILMVDKIRRNPL